MLLSPLVTKCEVVWENIRTNPNTYIKKRKENMEGEREERERLLRMEKSGFGFLGGKER